MTNAEQLCKRYEKRKAERQSKWDTLWQSIADYIVPRKSGITTKKTPNAEDWINNIYSDVASNANIVMAAGMVTNSTPITNRWMSYEVSDVVKTRNAGAPNAVRWYAEATDTVMREMARSNFYTQIHEAHLERNPFGTCCIFCDEGKRSLLNFRTIPVGTYCIEEDYEGFVDRVWVECQMTARQIVQQFKIENCGEKVKDAYKDENKQDNPFTIIHYVFPREERDPKKMDKENKPIGSIYLCLEDKNILRESGYDEMPYAVGRYLRWPGEVYGWGPGLQVLPIVRQLNFIEKQLDVLAEKAAEPPKLIPSNLSGQVDTRAGGITIFDENLPQAMPREWMTQGRYDLAQFRVEAKEKAIRDAFHNDLFQMFSQIDSSSRMTQLEVMQRSAEKLDQFSPAFTSFQSEVLEPLMRRVFGILFNAGAFGEPPADALIDGKLVLPKFAYNSKLSLALKSLDNRALIDSVNILLPMAQINPTVFDRLNLDESTKMILENSGVPPRCMNTNDEVAGIQQERAQQQQAIMQTQMLEQGSKAAANLGKMPPEMREQAAEQLA
jgi:hypothetical protein